MRNAPLVMYPVGHFLWIFWLCGGLGLGGAILTGWLLSVGQIGIWLALVSVLTLFAVGAAGLPLALRKKTICWLHWNGQVWRCLDDEQNETAQTVSSVVVILDLQQALLLRLTGASVDVPGTQQWVWLYKGFAPVQWHDMRCAVYSPLK